MKFPGYKTLFLILCGILTVMIGYNIHGSIGWCIIDFILWPIVILKWVIFKQVNLTIIKSAFSWFLK